jgi:hypothetical protein
MIEPEKKRTKRFDEKQKCRGHGIYACSASPLHPVSTKMGLTFSGLLTGYGGGEFVVGLCARSICETRGCVGVVVNRTIGWLDQGLAGCTIWVYTYIYRVMITH